MKNHQHSSYLERKIPLTNMSRFYEVTTTPTLFGEFSVIRRWGRIGSHGKTLELVFTARSDADQYSAQIITAKTKRGYARP